MAEIDGGSLSFKSILDNGQLNAAIDETLRRVQGFSDAVAGSGDVMDKTTQEMVECIEIQRKVIQDLENSYNDLTAKINAIEPGDAQNQLIEQANSVKQELDAEKQGLVDLMNELNNLQRTTSGAASSLDQIRVTLGQIGAACEEHEQAIAKLSAEYDRVSHAASDAFMSGRDDDYRALQDRADAIKGEVTVRKQLLNELRNQSNALEDEAQKIEKAAQEAENAAQSHVSFRTRLREVREELMQLELAGDTSSERYKQLQAQMGELSEAMDAVTTQQNMLKRGERMWDGLLSGLSGVSGAFSAAQGAVALFSGENENLQKIMLKVQSLMAVTIGLKEVQLALDKDEAFQLVTVAKAKDLLTAANVRLAAALHISNTAAAALMATLTLGLSVAITAVIVALTRMQSKQAEAKKQAEEFNNKVAEAAAEPVTAYRMLQAEWLSLTGSLKEREKWVQDNADKFEDLGYSVRNAKEAEELLVTNSAKFVEAMMLRAKATATSELAVEKYKKVIEAQNKLDTTPKAYVSKKGTYTDGYGVQRKGVVLEKSSNWKEAEEELERAEEAYNSLVSQQIKFTQQEKEILASIGNQTGKVVAGSVEAAEKELSRLQELYKKAATDAERADIAKQIAEQQKELNRISYNSGENKSGGKEDADPFAEQLNERKALYSKYLKWVTSSDETVRKAANTEFANLLAEGATYIDYLKNQRDQILAVDVSDRTKAQNKQLRQLNDAIAEETKKTVLEAFNEELNAQLSNARTVLDMLNIIEQRRKELSGDGTELDNAKADALNEAEENAQDQLRQETESLLEEYASYVEQKRRLEQQFNDDVALMMREREKATTDAQRAEIDNAIQNRTNQYNKDVRNIGGVDYDAMLAEYGTFEERKQAIIDDYDEKRRAAQEAGNTEMVEAIDRAQAQALSKFALDELQAHPDWELMFGDLDEISTKKLQELIDKINNLDGAYLGIEFDPKDLETLKNKIKEMQNEIRERNPFKSLISSIKEYGKAADDESKKKALTNMFESASGAIDLVGGAFDAVTSGLEKMGVTMDEQTQAIIGDIGGILDGAGQVASGIATGNPLSIIQGSIGLLSSAFDLFNSRDRKAEKSIKRHQEAIDKLKASYEQLEWAVDKALGAEVYNNQMGLIHNMEQQQAHLRGMISDEQSKKKTDNGKIQDYQNQIAELDRQIQDMYDEIANDILQTNAKDFASTLADSLTEAFKAGEDAANAFEQTVNEVLQNAIVNQLKKKFLENQLQSALDSLYTDMGYWSGDNFIFDGLTDAEIADFKAKVQAAANNYNQALDVYKDLFKDLEIDDDSEDSLTGAVKGVTEETADIIAGQMNAIRINQMEATQVLRQSLQALNTIANNTAYNRLLQDILSAVRELQRPSGDSLRSQGLS